MKTEKEFGVMFPKAKEYHSKDSFLEPSKEHGPVDTLILDLQHPEL